MCIRDSYIVARFLRQVLIAAHAGNVAVPARHGAEDGLCLRQDGREGEIVRQRAIQLILHAQRDLLPAGQHIQLRQRDLGRALDAATVARGDKVNRADAARTAGGSAVFAALFTQVLGLLAKPLCCERAFADAGRCV